MAWLWAGVSGPSRPSMFGAVQLLGCFVGCSAWCAPGGTADACRERRRRSLVVPPGAHNHPGV
jgi:hypothetical protein